MDEEKLITLVKQYTFLYDKCHKSYSNNSVRDNAWEQIARDIGNVTGNECKEKWKHIRECYRKAIVCRERSGSKGGKSKKPWKYEKELSFLKTFMPPATPQTSNLQAKITEIQQVESEPSDIGSCDAANFDEPMPSTPVFSHSHKRKAPKDSVAGVLKEYLEKSNPLASTYPQTDAITTLFLSMATTVKSLPPDLQILAKKGVMEVVTEFELIALNRQTLSVSESSSSIEVNALNRQNLNVSESSSSIEDPFFCNIAPN